MFCKGDLVLRPPSSPSDYPSLKVFQIRTADLCTNFCPFSVLDEEYKSPELVEYQTEAGHRAYGMVYRPGDYEEGIKYPTVLFVYGGPQVQLVTNAFKGLKYVGEILLL